MTGITREQAAQAVAALFGTTARQTHESHTYDPWEVTDNAGKKWRFVYDGSIETTRRECGRQAAVHDRRYSVEMNSPKLEYSEMKKLQEVIRALRRAGAAVNDSCGMHVHVDASRHTPRSLRNALSIMYSKEDILFRAIGAKPERIQQYCQYSRENVVRTVRALPPHLTMEQLKQAWYGGRDGSFDHYNWTRYYALNLHSVFYRGTLEWRCFESTLHAGVARANITLALAISAQAINQTRTLAKNTPVPEHPAFTFRTFLLRLGLVGEEYKNVRMHLLKDLPGDPAWRYDRSQYICLQNRRTEQREAR